MLKDLIVYCAVNTTATAPDAVADLVDRLFEAITNAPAAADTAAADTAGMLWEDHLKRNNRATIPYNAKSLAFFHSEWAEGFLGWHDGDCGVGAYVVRYEDCEVNWRYRECLTDLEWSPSWGARRHDLDTCGHE